MKSSPLFSLNKHDLFKGILLAILTPAVFIIEQTINAGSLTFDWKTIGMASAAGFVGYIIKNFLTPLEAPKTEEPK